MYRNVDVPFEKTKNYGNLSSSELFPLPHILLPYRQFTNFSYNHKLFIIAKRINKMKKNFFLRCFPVDFVKFLRTPFLQNNSERLLLFLTFLL